MSVSVTIITPVFNSAQTIGDCLRSVQSQQLDVSIEHLVMDGDSTDDTVAIARSMMVDGTRVLSQSDNGMYDAINKGLSLAKGDIIGVLNADDVYADRLVLDTVIRTMNSSQVETAYGDVEYVSQTLPHHVVRFWRSGPYRRERFKWGWMPPHPTFFVRRSVYEQLGDFRSDMRIAADYELMLRFLFRHRITSVYVPRCLVRMRLGGLSNTPSNLLRKSMEDIKACKLNGARLATWIVGCKMLRKLPQFVMRDRRGNRRAQ